MRNHVTGWVRVGGTSGAPLVLLFHPVQATLDHVLMAFGPLQGGQFHSLPGCFSLRGSGDPALKSGYSLQVWRSKFVSLTLLQTDLGSVLWPLAWGALYGHITLLSQPGLGSLC